MYPFNKPQSQWTDADKKIVSDAQNADRTRPFTDDDLKQLKAWLKPESQEWFKMSHWQMAASIARFEAGEAVAEYGCWIHKENEKECGACQRVAAWRKAAGK